MKSYNSSTNIYFLLLYPYRTYRGSIPYTETSL